MADLSDDIESNATGPRRAKADGVEMEQHGLADQIEADRYLASKAATAAGGLGIKRLKIKPPGTV